MEQYDVFISYRRDGAEYLAHNLYERLREKGYSVFQDIESLRSGNFNDALYDIIALCNDVILVLPPNGLDRCANEDDWVRKEIAFALSNGKNVVPIMMPGFEWPDTLPDDTIEIKQMRFWVITCSIIAEVCILLSISIYDIKRRKIKNSALALLLIIRTTQLIAIDSLDSVIYSVIGIVFVTVVVIIAKRFFNRIGQGDLKLCIVTGYIVGFKMLPIAFTVSTLLIILFALIKKGKYVIIPYGPFASIGIIMSIPSMLLR